MPTVDVGGASVVIVGEVATVEEGEVSPPDVGLTVVPTLVVGAAVDVAEFAVVVVRVVVVRVVVDDGVVVVMVVVVVVVVLVVVVVEGGTVTDCRFQEYLETARALVLEMAMMVLRAESVANDAVNEMNDVD